MNIDWLKLGGWVLALVFCVAWWSVMVALVLYAAE